MHDDGTDIIHSTDIADNRLNGPWALGFSVKLNMWGIKLITPVRRYTYTQTDAWALQPIYLNSKKAARVKT